MTRADTARLLAAAGCVYAEEEAAVLAASARTQDQLDAMLARRIAGEPLEYVVGWVEFRGRRLVVDPGVFVPRRRSELLVEEAASLARCLADGGHTVTVVDLCCGAGAIGAALATELPDLRLHAVDLDPRAVACAERNLTPLGGVVHRGDLFSPLPRRLRRRVDVVVASPPYVPSGELGLLPAEAREFEPVTALDGGGDGLDVVRRIARLAPRWLSPRGRLAIEVASGQVEPCAWALEERGYAARTVTSRDGVSAVVVGHLSR